jgi:hypothetical protein
LKALEMQQNDKSAIVKFPNCKSRDSKKNVKIFLQSVLGEASKKVTSKYISRGYGSSVERQVLFCVMLSVASDGVGAYAIQMGCILTGFYYPI